SGFTQSSLKKIDKDLKKVQRDFPFVGFAAGIVKADAVIFSKGYGFGNKEEKKPFTKHTIQPVGSVSKTVVGLALLQAIEQHYFT
ncbi:serine hydrolase domain-containing protein, partial [Microbacterium sp. GbtcB4]|uniref:serine hydrolase n=1 Tax=Microbacterium sp. GbtcB4 TaxID=2824749 RepID=UPI001C2F9E6B